MDITKHGIFNGVINTSCMLQALEELQDFMIINGVPNKDRQKLLRNLRVSA